LERKPVLFKAVDISVHYAGVEAVQQVTIMVEKGEIVTLIGANGAGKTSTLLAVSGLVGLSGGEIWFLNHRIDKLQAHEIARFGIIQVPEGRRLFPDLSIDENLSMGAYMRKDKGKARKVKQDIWDMFPILFERRKQKAKTLSGGEQQMLAISRAIMGDPKLMLLDEPSLGLSPLLVQEFGKIITQINLEREISIILVEQNANLALRIAHRGYVMEMGKIVLEGETQHLLQNRTVKEAYLGG
jgi:branched-chain amino acid transport system ATP-binding protein